jgi:activating signal cointegrator 1
MIAEPLLIDAEVVEKDDKESRVPKWNARADWSSGDTYLAFWSAHPPDQRDQFMTGRAEWAVINLREQIGAQRRRQHELWAARRHMIEINKKMIAELPNDDLGKRRRKYIEDHQKEDLLSLRAQMIVSRYEVRRCVRYVRAVQPKPASKHIGTISGSIAGKRVHISMQKEQAYTVLSLWQPWASMVAWGIKQFETRSWSTQYRGVLLIHAAKHWTQSEKDYCSRYPFAMEISERLGGAISDMPRGCIIGSVELVDILPTEWLTRLAERERAVGNFTAGRFAWKLVNARELATPIPVKGGQGLFKWAGVIE